MRDDRTLGDFKLSRWKRLRFNRSLGRDGHVCCRVILLVIGDGLFQLRDWLLSTNFGPIRMHEL